MTDISEDVLKQVITVRKSDSHKGNYGRILLIGGSENYGGAIIMATEAALNAVAIRPAPAFKAASVAIIMAPP